MQVSKSNKLANVCYDIRGPVLKHAKRLEEEGHRILKLNIGNPAPFGFEAPDEILQDVIRNSAHYWLLAGLNISYWVFAPNSAAATPMKALPQWTQYLVWTGLATYVYGELANFYTHIVLSNLRPAGTTKRGIPKGFGFNWVTCPTYS